MKGKQISFEAKFLQYYFFFILLQLLVKFAENNGSEKYNPDKNLKSLFYCRENEVFIGVNEEKMANSNIINYSSVCLPIKALNHPSHSDNIKRETNINSDKIKKINKQILNLGNNGDLNVNYPMSQSLQNFNNLNKFELDCRQKNYFMQKLKYEKIADNNDSIYKVVYVCIETNNEDCKNFSSQEKIQCSYLFSSSEFLNLFQNNLKYNKDPYLGLQGINFMIFKKDIFSDECTIDIQIRRCKIFLCDKSCDKCISSNPSQCLNCAENYFPKQNISHDSKRCYNSIPPKENINGFEISYFFNKNKSVWTPCDISCEECISESLCTKCRNTSYPISNQATNCNSLSIKGKSYKNNSLRILLNEIKIYSPNDKDDYYNYFDKSNIDINYFINRNATIKDKSPKFKHLRSLQVVCDASCSNCINSPKECINCSENYFFIENDISKNCFSLPKDGYYKNINSNPIVLSLCNQECLKCQDQSNNCLVCNTSSNFYPVDSSNPLVCLDKDTSGYIFSGTNLSRCNQKCAQCSGDVNICTGCNISQGFFPLEGSTTNCYFDCPNGYFKNMATETCETCGPSCSTCLNKALNCLSCKPGYYQLEDKSTTCSNTLPEKYYFDSNKNIYATCPFGCKTCESKDKCLSCIDGYIVDSVSLRCSSICKMGEYFDTTKKTCKDCNTNCTRCLNGTECVSCKENLFKFIFTPDPTNQISSDISEEEAIEPLVHEDSNNPNDFGSLPTATSVIFYDKSNCYEDCPIGYYKDQYQFSCLKCGMTNCKICDSKNTCQECNNQFELISSNYCVEACQEGFYRPKSVDSAIPECQPCDETCKTCSKFNDFCTSCPTGFLLKEKTLGPKNETLSESASCYEECPSGYYGDYEDMACIKCDPSCATCDGETNFSCLSCNLGEKVKLISGKCIIPCPQGTYNRLNSNDCIKYNIKNCFEKINFQHSNTYLKSNSPFEALLEIVYSQECRDTIDTQNFMILIEPYNEYFEINMQEEIFQILYYMPDDFDEENLFFNVIISYLNEPIEKLPCKVDILIYELQPLIKNEESLSFTYGYDIKIDASLSFDERFTILYPNLESTDDKDLRFIWMCDNEINSLCLKGNNILTLKFEDYKKILKFPIPTVEKNKDQKVDVSILLTMILILKKDTRSNSHEINIEIIKTFLLFGDKFVNVFDNIETLDTTNIDTGNIDVSKYINIDYKVEKGEEIFIDFSFSFLGDFFDKAEYTYHWNVEAFNGLDPNIVYGNGQNEEIMHINNAYLKLGKNKITLELTSLDQENIHKKEYIFEKIIGPQNGECAAVPSQGISLSTKVTFYSRNWVTKFKPLVYRIKFKDVENDNFLDISNGIFKSSNITTSALPVGSEYYLEATDSLGVSTMVKCALKILSSETSNGSDNNNTIDIKNLLNKETDIKKRFLLVSIVSNNDRTRSSEEGNVSQEKDIIDNSISLLNDFLSSKLLASNLSLENLDLVINRLVDITKRQITSSDIPLIIKGVNIITLNISTIIKYMSRIDLVYYTLDNLVVKSNSNEEFKANKELLEQIYANMVILNERLFGRIREGQNMLVENTNYDSQLAKQSKNNIKPLCVGYRDEKKRNLNVRNLNSPENLQHFDNKIHKRKYKRIRYLQSSEAQKCSDPDSQVMSLDDKLLKNISDLNPDTKSLGFAGQVNYNKNIPIEEPSFSNSFNFSLSTTDKNGKLRRLILENFSSNKQISFEIRLKIPDIKSSNSSVPSAACVQYQKKQAQASCESWFDADTQEVVCVCNQQGLTVNVLDSRLTNLSKLGQFPSFDASFSFTGLLSLVIIMFITSSLLDIIDYREYKLKNSIYFDEHQQILLKFHNMGFKKESKFLDLIRLFILLVKNTNPVYSIFAIYDKRYNRKIRTLDFFFELILSFFFTLFPFYVTDNEQLIEMQAQRSIKNRNKTLDDLDVKIMQIIKGLIFSIIASIVTFFIKRLLDLIIYENVLYKSAFESRRKFNSSLKILYKNFDYEYTPKLKNAYMKLRIIIWFMNYLEESNIKTQILHHKAIGEFENNIFDDTKSERKENNNNEKTNDQNFETNQEMFNSQKSLNNRKILKLGDQKIKNANKNLFKPIHRENLKNIDKSSNNTSSSKVTNDQSTNIKNNLRNENEHNKSKNIYENSSNYTETMNFKNLNTENDQSCDQTNDNLFDKSHFISNKQPRKSLLKKRKKNFGKQIKVDQCKPIANKNNYNLKPPCYNIKDNQPHEQRLSSKTDEVEKKKKQNNPNIIFKNPLYDVPSSSTPVPIIANSDIIYEYTQPDNKKSDNMESESSYFSDEEMDLSNVSGDRENTKTKIKTDINLIIESMVSAKNGESPLKINRKNKKFSSRHKDFMIISANKQKINNNNRYDHFSFIRFNQYITGLKGQIPLQEENFNIESLSYHNFSKSTGSSLNKCKNAKYKRSRIVQISFIQASKKIYEEKLRYKKASESDKEKKDQVYKSMTHTISETVYFLPRPEILKKEYKLRNYNNVEIKINPRDFLSHLFKETVNYEENENISGERSNDVTNRNVSDKIINYSITSSIRDCRSNKMKVMNTMYDKIDNNPNEIYQSQHSGLMVDNCKTNINNDFLKNISCFEISILHKRNKSNQKFHLRLTIKLIVVFIMILFLLFYITIFIRTIYINYMSKTFQVCIMPLISVICVDILVTSNFSIFISAFILHFWGLYIINMQKKNFILQIIIKILVAPIHIVHYNNLQSYKQILKFYKIEDSPNTQTKTSKRPGMNNFNEN